MLFGTSYNKQREKGLRESLFSRYFIVIISKDVKVGGKNLPITVPYSTERPIYYYQPLDEFENNQ